VFRRFLIAVLIFLIAVVVAADRVGAIVAAHVLAGKVQTDEHLPSRPSASIGGFPFLTQAFSGKYSDVTITAHNLRVDAVQVTTLTAHLHGVHLPLSKVVHSSVTRVPVDRVDGTAFVSFANVNTYLAGKHLSLRVAPGANGTATVTDRLVVHGKRLSLRGVGAVTVRHSVVHVRVTKLAGAVGLPNRVASFSVPLRGLPFRIQVRSVSVTSTGLSGTGAARNIVLGSPGG
jgi:LmeA-like phospholipid-binding